jgi:hypothetical protein
VDTISTLQQWQQIAPWPGIGLLINTLLKVEKSRAGGSSKQRNQ